MNKKLIYLQFARGIAALIVVFHHITASESFYFGVNSLRGIFDPGWNAVDFFFVLSGFIIYYAHSDDIGRPTQWPRYMSKRLIRIYPIYWVIAGVSLVFLLLKTSKGGSEDISAALTHTSYIVKSLLLIPQQLSPFLTVAWSLCFEMFFYWMFGIGILTGKKILWIISITYGCLLFFQLIFPVGNSHHVDIPFFASGFHLEFLLGILTAYLFKKGAITVWPFANRSSVSDRQRDGSGKLPAARPLWTIGLILFAATWMCSWFFPANFGKFTIASRVSYGLASGLIILGLAQLRLSKDTALTRFFALLGDSSYVLYLVHPVVLAILFKSINVMGFHGNKAWINYGIYPLAALFCILTGFLVHLKVEKKILSALNRFSKSKLKPAVKAS